MGNVHVNLSEKFVLNVFGWIWIQFVLEDPIQMNALQNVTIHLGNRYIHSSSLDL